MLLNADLPNHPYGEVRKKKDGAGRIFRETAARPSLTISATGNASFLFQAGSIGGKIPPKVGKLAMSTLISGL